MRQPRRPVVYFGLHAAVLVFCVGKHCVAHGFSISTARKDATFLSPLPTLCFRDVGNSAGKLRCCGTGVIPLAQKRSILPISARRSAGVWRQSQLCLWMLPKSRQERGEEIQRKIMQLKREGRLGKKKDAKAQAEKSNIRDDTSDTAEADEEFDESSDGGSASPEYLALKKLRRSRELQGKSAALTKQYEEKVKKKLGSSGNPDSQQIQAEGLETGQQNVSDEEEGESKGSRKTEDDEGDEMVELVARKLAEKAERERAEREARRMKEVNLASEAEAEEKRMNALLAGEAQREPTDKAGSREPTEKSLSDSGTSARSTTGVGGNWNGPESKDKVETYKPSRGSWGAFPRPKDISKTYGGGKRVGAGITSEAEERRRMEQSAEETRERLKAYREKVGIEVQSEKDYKNEIEEALAIASRAMQRGVYGSAVSALEKVTRYCSTNSPVGGKVFLELAMAYEAVGRTDEAITVYTTLSKSRTEDIKFNAQRLLYGIEAINFMRNEARDSRFSRKKVSQEFIDATGFANIADNFDKVYNTAYVDMDNPNFYKRLTESVVRSSREARLILLKATFAGEVDRLRIVQALRFLSRDFDQALRDEEDRRKAENEEEEVAVMDGVPIVKPKRESSPGFTASMDKFRLSSPEQMLENCNGEWRLQLVADKTGDGIRFFNKTIAWQRINVESMQYEIDIPGFMTVKKKGSFQFDEISRIIERDEKPSEGSWFDLRRSFATNQGASASCQQIISVDSELFVARLGSSKAASKETVKDYFSVWRRVKEGTLSDR